MAREGYKPEQIINKLREAEILLNQGATVGEASRKIEVTDQTYYRWRKEYGSMRVEQAKRLKQQVTMVTSSPGANILRLMDVCDHVVTDLSDTAIFEGEHSLARDITEAWKEFGWACVKVQDYQSRIGWTA